VPRTAYLITTDRRPRCTKDRDRASSKPGHSERAAIRSSSPRAAAFTRPSEAGAFFFYPRSSNYGLALESHPQTRQRPLTWRDFVLAGAARRRARLDPGALWPRLVLATRRVTEAGPHMQMSASTSRSVTVSWPIGPRARGRWTRSPSGGVRAGEEYSASCAR